MTPEMNHIILVGKMHGYTSLDMMNWMNAPNPMLDDETPHDLLGNEFLDRTNDRARVEEALRHDLAHDLIMKTSVSA